MRRSTILILAVGVSWSCTGTDKPDASPVAADTDTDVDTDTDTDTDVDTDTDTDTGTVTASSCVEAAGNLVVVDGVGYVDLQDALDAAPAGARVEICPGTYVGTFEATVGLTIVGPSGAAQTVLDGAGALPVLTVAPDTVVQGLTLTGAGTQGVTDSFAGGRGGGLKLASMGSLQLLDSVVSGNEAISGGGLWLFPQSEVVLTGTVIEDNAAEQGGGIYGVNVDLDLTGGTVASNLASESGGGIHLSGSLTGGLVTGNTAGCGFHGGGGGLFLTNDATLDGVEVALNHADCEGGGVGVGTESVLQTWTDLSVHDNTAGLQGGGIYARGTDVSLLGTTEITGNSSAEDGGGIASAARVVSGGRVVGNTATGSGGGVFLRYGELRGVQVLDNVAQRGGGVAVDDDGHIVDCLVDGNQADLGGGVHLTWEFDGFLYGEVSVTGGALTNNDATTAGGGLYLQDAHFALDVAGTEVSGNTSGDGGGLWLRAATRLDGITLERNVATGQGGGAFFDQQSIGVLEATDCDLGAGLDDNVPVDLTIRGVDVTGYEDAETFVCDSGCTPPP